MSGWWSAGEISETSEQKNSRAPILLSLYIGYVNAETLTLFGSGTAGKFGTGNTLLRYGIGTRCAEQPPTVRNEATECGHCVDSSDPRIRGCDHCVAGSGSRVRLLQEWFRRWHNAAAITDGVCFDGFVGKAQRLQRCCGESR